MLIGVQHKLTVTGEHGHKAKGMAVAMDAIQGRLFVEVDSSSVFRGTACGGSTGGERQGGQGWESSWGALPAHGTRVCQPCPLTCTSALTSSSVKNRVSELMLPMSNAPILLLVCLPTPCAPSFHLPQPYPLTCTSALTSSSISARVSELMLRPSSS